MKQHSSMSGSAKVAAAPESKKSSPSRRYGWLLLAVCVFGLSSFVAFTQDPYPIPFQQPRPVSWEWLKHPIEQNAFRRLPLVGELNDIFVLRDTELVWAVGPNGFIIHSKDGGKTWVKQSISMVEENGEKSQEKVGNSSPLRRAGLLPRGFFNGATPSSDRPRLLAEEPPPSNRSAPAEQGKSAPMGQAQLGGSLQPLEQDLIAVRFESESAGWIIAADGGLFQTADGGETWRRDFGEEHIPAWARLLAEEVGYSNLTDLILLTEGQGWATTSSGEVLPIVDGAINRTAVWQTFNEEGLKDLCHLPPGRIWAVGENGIRVASSDGGRTWALQTNTAVEANLTCVGFSSPLNGWAAGEKGTLLRTVDGGTNWVSVNPFLQEDFRAISFAGPQRGYLVTSAGTVLTSMAMESASGWRPLSVGMKAAIFDIDFSESGIGIAVGGNGTFLPLGEKRNDWNDQFAGLGSSFYAVDVFDSNHAWVAGDPGMLSFTRDGDPPWTKPPDSTQETIWNLSFGSISNGCAGTSSGILYTRNRGRTWFPAESELEGTGIRALTLIDADKGWAATDQGILRTTDGGASWRQVLPITNTPNALHFSTVNDGWIVGENGMALQTSDGGLNWKSRSFGAHDLVAVHFSSPTVGRIATRGGTLYNTDDGGQEWEPNSLPSAAVSSIHFVSAQHGYAGTLQGAILETRDGGATWHDLRPYGRYPAPWYYLSLFVVLALCVPGLKRQYVEYPERSIADLLVSDRPITSEDPDPLEFQTVAEGLARFIRNENTKPPLTIAITGAWGSGKSSLMNLLREDLARIGFRPVWFNAWHHETEEHMFAALLENIRAQAIPPWFRFEGFVFRFNLLAIRAKRRWLWFMALLLLVPFSIGYFLAYPERVPELGPILQALFTLQVPEKWASGLTVLATGLAPIISVWRGLRTFGVKPPNLFGHAMGKGARGEPELQTGFRYRFSQEFQEVTRALKPRTLVILIDDLDRCRPKDTLTVLQAVNFLVSSGDCFVVFGMDRDQVENSVARYVLEGATEPGNGQPGQAHEQKFCDPAGFAKRYLEKLINIEVPVPQATNAQLLALLKQQGSESNPKSVPGSASPAFHSLLLIASIPVLMAMGFVFGKLLFADSTSGNLFTASTGRVPVQEEVAEGFTGAPPQDSLSGQNGGMAAFRIHTLLSPKDDSMSTGMLGVGSAILCVLALVAVARRPVVVLHDSREFLNALDLWHPMLCVDDATPRSLKRFLNRVRYLAMRQRTHEAEQTIMQALVGSILRRTNPFLRAIRLRKVASPESKAGPPTPPTAVPEDLLVALAAIETHHPEWLRQEDLFLHFHQFLKQQDLPDELREQLSALQKYSDIREYRDRFLRLTCLLSQEP